MTSDDQALVCRWLSTPEVDRWWGDPDEDDGDDDDDTPFEEELGDPNIACGSCRSMTDRSPTFRITTRMLG